jgi:hypothetical protein
MTRILKCCKKNAKIQNHQSDMQTLPGGIMKIIGSMATWRPRFVEVCLYVSIKHFIFRHSVGQCMLLLCVEFKIQCICEVYS